jgi:hypothetical protein
MHADARSAKELWTDAVVCLCFCVWCGMLNVRQTVSVAGAHGLSI